MPEYREYQFTMICFERPRKQAILLLNNIDVTGWNSNKTRNE